MLLRKRAKQSWGEMDFSPRGWTWPLSHFSHALSVRAPWVSQRLPPAQGGVTSLPASFDFSLSFFFSPFLSGPHPLSSLLLLLSPNFSLSFQIFFCPALYWMGPASIVTEINNQLTHSFPWLVCSSSFLFLLGGLSLSLFLQHIHILPHNRHSAHLLTLTCMATYSLTHIQQYTPTYTTHVLAQPNTYTLIWTRKTY